MFKALVDKALVDKARDVGMFRRFAGNAQLALPLLPYRIRRLLVLGLVPLLPK